MPLVVPPEVMRAVAAPKPPPPPMVSVWSYLSVMLDRTDVVFSAHAENRVLLVPLNPVDARKTHSRAGPPTAKRWAARFVPPRVRVRAEGVAGGPSAGESGARGEGVVGPPADVRHRRGCLGG